MRGLLPSDNHGLYDRILSKKLAAAAISELVGSASCIVFDGELTSNEISFLGSWMLKHNEYAEHWPISELRKLIYTIWNDGIVTKEEKDELFKFLISIATNEDSDKVAAGIFEEHPNIEFANRSFMFTGEFSFYRRSVVEALVINRHGTVNESKSFSCSVDYLVVGSKGSQHWAKKRFGTKIKRAMELKSSGKSSCLIVHENDFLRAARI